MILRKQVLFALFGVLTMFGLARAMAGQGQNSITVPVAPVVPQVQTTPQPSQKPTVYVVISIREGAESDVIAASSFMATLDAADQDIDYQIGDPAVSDSSGPVIHFFGIAPKGGKPGDNIFSYVVTYHNENEYQENLILSAFGFLTPENAEDYGEQMVGLLSQGTGEYLYEISQGSK